MSLTSYFMEATYLVASILFILGLKRMSHPETARRGMFLAEAGMAAAIVGTLVGAHILTWGWIIAGLTLGSLIGGWMAVSVPMTAMPQRTALSHAFGAFAAALVGVGEFVTHGSQMGVVTRGALGFEVMLGALTTTGSLIAAGKLQGIIRGKPIQFRGQNVLNLLIALAMTGSFVFFWMHPAATAAFYAMLGLAFVFGVMLVIPIGSADMPVVMSLLNSYAGLAAAATGFVLGNNVLIIAGTLDGFSGFILSVLMCKAMNRSITNVLFGGFGSVIAAVYSRNRWSHARDQPRRRRHAARLRQPRHLCPRLRPRHRPGPARRPRTRRAAGGSRRHHQVRHPSRRRPHARPHERAARGGQRPLLRPLRNGADQPGIPLHRRSRRHRRQRRR